jgi:hypothetical protein
MCRGGTSTRALTTSEFNAWRSAFSWKHGNICMRSGMHDHHAWCCPISLRLTCYKHDPERDNDAPVEDYSTPDTSSTMVVCRSTETSSASVATGGSSARPPRGSPKGSNANAPACNRPCCGRQLEGDSALPLDRIQIRLQMHAWCKQHPTRLLCN